MNANRISKYNFFEKFKTYSSRYRTDQNKGFWAEDEVIAHLTCDEWQLRGRRVKLKNGEVDLVFKKQKTYLFVEVKFVNNSWNVFERITREQKHKLILNRVYYSLLHKEFEFSTAIAFVERIKYLNNKNRLVKGQTDNRSRKITSNLNLIHLEE